MEFAQVSLKLARLKQRERAKFARLAKTIEELVLRAMQRFAQATQPMRPERALRAKQLVAPRQSSEKQPGLASPARVQLALAAQRLDQPAPVFAWPARQRSISLRD
jgi:hypothetical protein